MSRQLCDSKITVYLFDEISLQIINKRDRRRRLNYKIKMEKVKKVQCLAKNVVERVEPEKCQNEPSVSQIYFYLKFKIWSAIEFLLDL